MRQGDGGAGADPDPAGVIAEAYRIEGISAADCRTIFFDWALASPGEADREAVDRLLARHGDAHPDHPMTAVLREGLGTPRPGRRRR